MEKQALLNTYINNLTMPETIAAIEQMIADNKKSYVVAINVDVVMKIENDPYLKQVVDNADMVLVDGKPLVWISKLHGKPLKAKISGSDLVPLLCDVATKKGYSIFIIGGKDGMGSVLQCLLCTQYLFFADLAKIVTVLDGVSNN